MSKKKKLEVKQLGVSKKLKSMQIIKKYSAAAQRPTLDQSFFLLVRGV